MQIVYRLHNIPDSPLAGFAFAVQGLRLLDSGKRRCPERISIFWIQNMSLHLRFLNCGSSPQHKVEIHETNRLLTPRRLTARPSKMVGKEDHPFLLGS